MMGSYNNGCVLILRYDIQTFFFSYKFSLKWNGVELFELVETWMPAVEDLEEVN
jgi:hypothetical protein